MDATGRGCGALYEVYTAAREGDLERAREHWSAVEALVARQDEMSAARIDEALAAEDNTTVREVVADLVFTPDSEPTLDGPVATFVGAVLYLFGYLAAFVLFFRAHSRVTVVDRLRWAYRTVGVDIRDTETVDGTARTVFRCPYRNIGMARYGRRSLCHDVLDRVDDGYVTFLGRRRGLDYDRPRACAGSDCCYSVVTESR